MSTNYPLNSSDQSKLLIFTFLLIPSIIGLFGIVPIIFLIFGLFMAKKNEDFSHIEIAVKNFKFCAALPLIGSMFFAMYFIGSNDDRDHRFDSLSTNLAICFFVAAIAISYLIAVQILFVNPLRQHSDWVKKNGIFSSKSKTSMSFLGESEVDIIKGEKLKSYSVADELLKWAKLKEAGHISEEQFNEARTKLLKRN